MRLWAVCSIEMAPRLAFVAMLLLAAACTGPGPLPTPMGTSPATIAEEEPAWVVSTDAELGISVRVPSSWSVVWGPCPTCADPRGLLDAASFEFGASNLFCRAIPVGQVVLSLSEKMSGFGERPRLADYPPRPQRFEITELGSRQVTKGCSQPSAQLFRFRDEGRFLYSWVVFGEEPPTDLLSDVESILNSLQVSTASETDS